MTQKSKGFILIISAICMALGLAGGVETLGPDAGYNEWFMVLVALAGAGVIGLIGFSYLQEE